jgi:nitroimidazol reductase NimA-like FMN-containing flavoprotein (pyridoxamine 5'-phosphate oxidase superfamily)
VLEPLDEAECLRLISPGGLGRLVYSGRFDLTVLPVNYRLHDGSIVFRTAAHGIAGAEYRVAFEVDDVDLAAQEGWSVLIQGSAHHVDSEAERAAVAEAGVEPWAGGDRQLFIRVTPSRITGRRIRHI